MSPLLDYADRYWTARSPHHATAAIAGHLRRVRPDVVITFGPDGAYGHPDHIAISQFTSAAIVTAADPMFASEGDARHPASCGRQAVLHCLAAIDVVGVSVRVQEADIDGRRRRTPDRPMG